MGVGVGVEGGGRGGVRVREGGGSGVAVGRVGVCAVPGVVIMTVVAVARRVNRPLR